MNPLKQLEVCGQSPWLDYLKRSLIESGGLRTLVERDGLKGITSNPSIFEKAIAESDEYADTIKEFQAEGDRSVSAIYEHLAIADIRAAADVLAPVYETTNRRDGYVSLECSPYLANDTEATVVEAHRLWVAVARPNLMVKVPATQAGIPAIRRLIAQGLNINITLLFSLGVYDQVIEVYLSGLEDLKLAGGDLSRVGSVASMFVSRVDTAVDKLLNEIDDERASDRLRGKVGIANAQLAYARYKDAFAGRRWQALAQSGATSQRLLWASTSSKSPAFKDTMYVEALIGRDTVDTIPPATMDAFRDHGEIVPDAIERSLPEARATLATLEEHGISLNDVTDRLVADGVEQFSDAFDRLLGAVAKRRYGSHPDLEIFATSPAMKAAFADEMEIWRSGGKIRRLWAGDKSLWTGSDENNWVGWLNLVAIELDQIQQLKPFADNVRQRGFSDIVLLGMGGSSLGPEVLSETLDTKSSGPHFHMLDSTDPAQISTLEQSIDLGKTLFIVSSKSGSTLEPNIFTDYFYERTSALVGREKAGKHFVAVTDPGSSLEQRAKRLHFSHIFYGTPSVGGRYSVLSKFGLVPAAAMGLDTEQLLACAQRMVRRCGPDVPPDQNPGVQLGVALGISATRFGRDKVTIVASPGISDLGAWLEQLLAESTGKSGRGLIPLAEEPVTDPASYGGDRFFAYIEPEGQCDPSQREFVEALVKAGHPVAKITVEDKYRVGQEFFRWEIATAVAGAIIGINPFDQPDVEDSKVKTTALMNEYEKSHKLLAERPIFRANGIALYADSRNADDLGKHNTLYGYLESHLGRAHAGDYVAILAYVERNVAHTSVLQGLRSLILKKAHAATCLEFGPRFQHSTGQAYKGGPNSGVFLQITCDDPVDIKVPGHSYTFGVVKAAQAQGDLDVLNDRARRTLRVHLKHVEAGLTELIGVLEGAGR
jgi:transaldolase/glucose-6-phosphate isomerase